LPRGPNRSRREGIVVPLFSFAVKPVPRLLSLEVEGPRDPAFGTPLRTFDLAIAAAAVAGCCAAVLIIATGGIAADPTTFAAVLVANVVTLTSGGLVPRSGGRGAGLTNISDRLEAVGGTIVVRSTPGKGTTIEGRVETGSSNGTGRDVGNV
jgi:hypothetical protein